MTEFLAYYESSSGGYMPVLVEYRPDGSHFFKKMKKRDIFRLPSNHTSYGDSAASDDEETPAVGWVMRHSSKAGLHGSWQKRFAVLRGPYLFLLLNPEASSLLGVVPLENCELYTPGGGVRSFVSDGANGFEFEVRHRERKSVLFSTATEEERDDWAERILDQSGHVNGVAVKESHRRLPSPPGSHEMQNVSVTRTRLGELGAKSAADEQLGSQWGAEEHKSLPSVSHDMFSPPPPPSQRSFQPSVLLGEDLAEQDSHHPQQASKLPDSPRNDPMDMKEAVELSKSRDEELREQARAERQQLQQNLENKIRFQQEGRKREAEAKERSHNKQRIELARLQEAKHPMTLAEMFRFLLSFANEELCEDADPDSPLQFPHLKGHWAENMLSGIYRAYCKNTGFMSLEEFVEFLEDSAVLHTHVPHDELDEPLAEFQSQLDPVLLLSTIPRDLGFSDATSELATVTSDSFRLNFAQFYQILLRITHVVYSELYEKSPSHAFNKLLQEAILPLACWSSGHHKRGSTDTLVTDERIVLLLMTYAPNLWRVFLSYGQDCRAKVPAAASSPYPRTAQQSERALFGSPRGAPCPPQQEFFSGIFMTEASCLRFCQDYGLMPHLMTRGLMKDLIFSLNREKTVSSRARPREPVAPTVFFQKTRASVIREQMGSSLKMQAYKKPMHFSPFDRNHQNATTKYLPQRLTNPTFTLEETGGLGFSEFVELIARVALEGMEAEAYNVLFPTPFSKILGILTVWGVADLKKLEEVRVIHTVE